MNIYSLIDEYNGARKKSARLLEKYMDLKARAQSPKSAGAFSEVKTRGKNTTEDLYIKVIRAAEMWQTAALDELETRQQLFELFMLLDDPEEMEVANAHLLDGEKADEIAARLGTSERQIFRKLKSGLKKLEKIARNRPEPRDDLEQ